MRDWWEIYALFEHPSWKTSDGDIFLIKKCPQQRFFLKDFWKEEKFSTNPSWLSFLMHNLQLVGKLFLVANIMVVYYPLCSDGLASSFKFNPNQSLSQLSELRFLPNIILNQIFCDIILVLVIWSTILNSV